VQHRSRHDTHRSLQQQHQGQRLIVLWLKQHSSAKALADRTASGLVAWKRSICDCKLDAAAAEASEPPVLADSSGWLLLLVLLRLLLLLLLPGAGL